MVKTINYKRLLVRICVIFICSFLASCNHTLSNKKQIEVISDIAGIVTDNYINEDLEKPLAISILEIKDLAQKSSNLYKAFEKYNEIKEYDIYLINNKVIVVTDIIFQEVKGYIISDEELEKDLIIHGLGLDGDRLSINGKIEDHNIYTFIGGL